MKKAIIRAIGRPMDSWQRQAIHMYLERLRPFAAIEVVELPEGHGGSIKPDPAKTRKAEAESLLKGIPESAYAVALDMRGKAVASEQLARLTAEWLAEGTMPVFLIGGSWGLDASVLKRANLVFSLGQLTLPHILARIVLLEQLYRAVMIRSGRKYHL